MTGEEEKLNSKQSLKNEVNGTGWSLQKQDYQSFSDVQLFSHNFIRIAFSNNHAKCCDDPLYDLSPVKRTKLSSSLPETSDSRQDLKIQNKAKEDNSGRGDRSFPVTTNYLIIYLINYKTWHTKHATIEKRYK